MGRDATFADRLRELLKETGQTQADLSRTAKISPSSISHYMKGDWEAKQDVVYEIASVCNVSPAWLMGFDVPMREKEKHNADSGKELTDSHRQLIETVEGLTENEARLVLSAVLGILKDRNRTD